MTAMDATRRASEVRKGVRRRQGLAWLAFFGSTHTLICCALPILLVSLGLGSTVASVTSTLPFVITLSQKKVWVFVGSGALLAGSGWLLYGRALRCPADPELGALCARATRWNRRVFWSSIALWGIGFFAAYPLFPVARALGFV